MTWEDGGPLEPPERGDYETALQEARLMFARCPDCGVATEEGDGGEGLRCGARAPRADGGCGWRASDDELVEAWAGGNEPEPAEYDNDDS